MGCNIVVVDEDDNEVGCEPRDVVDAKKLRYRASGLWIKNSNGDSLLARRAYTKTHYPGRWGSAVAGTVEEGETYEGNIVKEAEEELGLTDIELVKGPHAETSGEYSHFTQWFNLIVDEPESYFKIQDEEVVEIKWFSEEELRKELKDNPKEFVENMERFVDLFY